MSSIPLYSQVSWERTAWVGGTNLKVEILNTRAQNFNLLVTDAHGAKCRRKVFQATIFGRIGRAFDTTFFFWLHWVFVAVCGLSLVAVSGGYSLLQ